MKESDKVPFFITLVSSGSLCGPALLNASRRLRSRLRWCDTSSLNAPALPLLPVAPDLRRLSRQLNKTPTAPEPRPPKGRRDRGCSRLARCYPFPYRQGPRPKIALDPAPQKSSWIARQNEEGLATAGPLRKQPLFCLSPPHLALGAEESVFMDPHGPTIAPRCPAAVVADKMKHIDFQKESKNIFLPTISVLPLCNQSMVA